MQTGSTLLRVVPAPGAGWDVLEPGGTRSLAHADSSGAAVVRARMMLTSGGTVEVLDVNGELVSTQRVAAPSAGPQPWWYVHRSAALWIVAPLLIASPLFRVFDGGASMTVRLVAVAFALAGISALAAIIFSRRRDRRRDRPTTD